MTSGNETLSNDIINPGDILSSKFEIKTKCLKSDQPYKVHDTGDFRALARMFKSSNKVRTQHIAVAQREEGAGWEKKKVIKDMNNGQYFKVIFD